MTNGYIHKTMKRKSALFIILFQNMLVAQTIITFSPGVKLGYTFGENDGFIYGFEVSFVPVRQLDS